MDSENALDPRRHIFAAHQQETPGQVSKRVIKAFCIAHERQYGIETSLRAVEPKKKKVDGIIEINGSPVALELVSYRQRDEFHDGESADTVLRSELSGELGDSGLPIMNVGLNYRMEARTKRKGNLSPTRAKIPRGRDKDRFITEFIELVRIVAATPELYGKCLAFHENPSPPNGQVEARGWHYLDSKRFQTIAEHCVHVKLSRSRPDVNPTMRSSVDCRIVGVDTHHLETVLESKLGKLPVYRKHNENTPVWLVIHSDGHPLSTRLPPALLDEACDHITAYLRSASQAFDKVWFAENTCSADATELSPITW